MILYIFCAHDSDFLCPRPLSCRRLLESPAGAPTGETGKRQKQEIQPGASSRSRLPADVLLGLAPSKACCIRFQPFHATSPTLFHKSRLPCSSLHSSEMFPASDTTNMISIQPSPIFLSFARRVQSWHAHSIFGEKRLATDLERATGGWRELISAKNQGQREPSTSRNRT